MRRGPRTILEVERRHGLGISASGMTRDEEDVRFCLGAALGCAGVVGLMAAAFAFFVWFLPPAGGTP